MNILGFSPLKQSFWKVFKMLSALFLASLGIFFSLPIYVDIFFFKTSNSPKGENS
jgi:hypothetical protein